VATHREGRVQRSARRAAVAGLLLTVAAVMSGCSSSSVFEYNQTTHYLTAGRYAVSVADECGRAIPSVVTDITKDAWSYPLLNGTPLQIPTSGTYTVADEIGSDLMVNSPACSGSLRIVLTPAKS
jgi:hypothetical protein